MGPQVLDEYFSRHKNGVVERLHLIILRTELSHLVLEEVVKKEYVKYKKNSSETSLVRQIQPSLLHRHVIKKFVKTSRCYFSVRVNTNDQHFRLKWPK
jgi:hypothetical protein